LSLGNRYLPEAPNPAAGQRYREFEIAVVGIVFPRTEPSIVLTVRTLNQRLGATKDPAHMRKTVVLTAHQDLPWRLRRLYLAVRFTSMPCQPEPTGRPLLLPTWLVLAGCLG
jgi:hypothetical protein